MKVGALEGGNLKYIVGVFCRRVAFCDLKSGKGYCKMLQRELRRFPHWG